MSVRDDYLTVAESAVALMQNPAVAAKWNEPSALEDLEVGGLTYHLANQIFHIPQALPASGEPPLTLTENFARAVWVGKDPSFEGHVGMRRRSEDDATAGIHSLLQRVEPGLAEVKKLIAEAPADLVVHLRWTGWDLTFDDFLATRLLELVVHSDDLAVSIGVETPRWPESATLTVTDILTRIAVRTHGATAVVRALSRAERAPASISAL